MGEEEEEEEGEEEEEEGEEEEEEEGEGDVEEGEEERNVANPSSGFTSPPCSPPSFPLSQNFAPIKEYKKSKESGSIDPSGTTTCVVEGKGRSKKGSWSSSDQ